MQDSKQLYYYLLCLLLLSIAFVGGFFAGEGNAEIGYSRKTKQLEQYIAKNDSLIGLLQFKNDSIDLLIAEQEAIRLVLSQSEREKYNDIHLLLVENLHDLTNDKKDSIINHYRKGLLQDE